MRDITAAEIAQSYANSAEKIASDASVLLGGVVAALLELGVLRKCNDCAVASYGGKKCRTCGGSGVKAGRLDPAGGEVMTLQAEKGQKKGMTSNEL